MLQAGHIASELRKERVNWQWSGWAIASDLTSGETLPPKSSTAFPSSWDQVGKYVSLWGTFHVQILPWWGEEEGGDTNVKCTVTSVLS